jgi:asparagine synthase (glutamine-hydrolysing)
LAYGSTTGELTLFKNVRLLPGGSAWLFEQGRQPTRRRYFQPREWEEQPPLEDEEFERRFVEVARAALPKYVQSDLRVGISITGGLDTRMIMACLPQSERMPLCYTFGALSGETLDVRIGRRVAKLSGLEHHTLRITRDFLDNFGTYLDRTVLVTDGCSGALLTHEIFLTRVARSLAPIRLTGNFGSEVLRNISTLSPREFASELIDPAFRPSLDRARSREFAANPVTQSAFGEVPMHLFGNMAAARSQLTFRTPYLDNALVQLAYRASSRARSSPRAALRLISEANPGLAKISTDRGLSVETAAVAGAMRRLWCEATFKLDWLHKEGLSGALLRLDPLFTLLSGTPLLGLHKFLPYRGWFRKELASYVADVLGSARARSQAYWNRPFLQTIARDHALGRVNYMQEIGSVLTIEAVQRVLVDTPWKSAQLAIHEQHS